ncbi:hypothetical protein KP509_19G036000 [Ceratopteris richardii]|uniref:Uncharacterized protein n=1 Tax=Ceratopteris richardii TaxID=49495 RepID=A0A8T2SL67_CERRI|nr:hypothetical protein KP509_19G036000 [Ceratopteris richardii]
MLVSCITMGRGPARLFYLIAASYGACMARSRFTSITAIIIRKFESRTGENGWNISRTLTLCIGRVNDYTLIAGARLVGKSLLIFEDSTEVLSCLIETLAFLLEIALDGGHNKPQ